MDLASMVTPVSNAVEFRLVKVHATQDGALSAESQSKVDTLVQQFTASDNIKSLYYGQQIEDPTVVVFCAQSVSDVPQLELSCNEPGPWPTNGWLVPMKHDLDLVLAAPVIEICTAFNCNPTYIGAVKEFAECMDKDRLDGYHASAYGEITNPLSLDDGATPAKAANLVIGWDSKQAHVEGKEKPGNPILANIHLLREGRGGLAIFHVVFHLAFKKT